jgi:hypothetical protein
MVLAAFLGLIAAGVWPFPPGRQPSNRCGST